MSNRATNELSADHQLILQALEMLREMTEHMARNEAVDRTDLQSLLEFFDEFVHEYHDAKEELILIPALVEIGEHLQQGTVKPIVSCHRAIHQLMADLKSAFAAKNDQEFVKLSEQYQKLLTDHIFTEDRVLFESMAKALDELSDHRVAKEFNDFEPGLRERSKAKFLTLLRNRGRKYDSPLCV